jgi:hypothetical protein
MRFIAINKITAQAPQEQLNSLRQEELLAEWELQKKDILRQTHSLVNLQGTIFMMEAANEAEARQALERLPLMKAGLMDFDLYGYQHNQNYARLFEEL